MNQNENEREFVTSEKNAVWNIKVGVGTPRENKSQTANKVTKRWEIKVILN